MTNEKSNNSKVCVEQVASTKPQTIKLGLDVHADSIMVVRMVDHSAPQPAQKFTPAKFREWVKGQLRLAEAVHSCYEAGPFGYGLHRYLVELGIQNLVVQPWAAWRAHSEGVRSGRRRRETKPGRDRCDAQAARRLRADMGCGGWAEGS